MTALVERTSCWALTTPELVRRVRRVIKSIFAADTFARVVDGEQAYAHGDRYGDGVDHGGSTEMTSPVVTRAAARGCDAPAPAHVR